MKNFIAFVLIIIFLCLVCLFPINTEEEKAKSVYNYKIYNNVHVNHKQKDRVSPKSGIFE